MSVQQATDATKSALIEFRMAILYGTLYSIGSLIGSILTALQGTTWVMLDSQAKFMIVMAITGSWITTILAFISKQSSRIKKTGEIFPTDDSDITQQTIGQVTQVTTVTPKINP